MHLALMSETAVEDEEATTEQLLELVREAFSSCEGDAVPLTTLGDKVRGLAVRRTLHNTHKQIKDKFGGWEAFLRLHAALEFSVVSGVVRTRRCDGAQTVVVLV